MHTLDAPTACSFRAWAPFVLLICGVRIAESCASHPKVAVSRNTPSIWPVKHPDRHITSGYGSRPRPRRRASRFHKGVDIAAPRGAAVVATADGQVIAAANNREYGRYIVIDHGGGLRTLYAHLSDRDVKKGKRVKRGERIGNVGKSGRATGFHLHYEVHVKRRHVDPRPYLPG